ncbi:MAG TPA: hypothetical protein VI259_22895, partial [Gemmatimonadaceae bacterium]
TPQVRVALQVQVAYDSDVEKALALLVEIASREPRVLRGAQAPKAFITGFSDSGINLELGMWINDPQVGHLDLRSAVSLAILKAFAANAIQIPYPQRDVRIVSQSVQRGNETTAQAP